MLRCLGLGVHSAETTAHQGTDVWKLDRHRVISVVRWLDVDVPYLGTRPKIFLLAESEWDLDALYWYFSGSGGSLGYDAFERLDRQSTTYIAQKRRGLIPSLEGGFFFNAQSVVFGHSSMCLQLTLRYCISDDLTKPLIMSPTCVFQSLAFMASAVSAFPFIGAGNQLSGISLPFNMSHLTPPSILSVPPSNISTGNALNIKCDGAQYGDKLNATDCKDARSYIGQGSYQFAWVERTVIFLKAHFSLPYRYMGGIYQSKSFEIH